MNQQMQTVSGRPVSLPVSSRLDFKNYYRMLEIVRQQGITVSSFVKDAIIEYIKRFDNQGKQE